MMADPRSPVDELTVIDAGAARDATGLNVRPARLAIEGGCVLWVGSPDATPGPLQKRIGRIPLARRLQRPDRLILPAMVNAHTHLDLTGLGPRPFHGEFDRWLADVARDRPGQPEAIRRSVRQGLALSHAGGVGWIGDFAGSLDALDAWRRLERPPTDRAESGPNRSRGESRAEFPSHGPAPTVDAVAFLELIGPPAFDRDALERLGAFASWLHDTRSAPNARHAVRFGLAPHAPYSASDVLFQRAGQLQRSLGVPLATHLAESDDEVRFLRDGTGPLQRLLQTRGKSPPKDALRFASHPVDWMSPHLDHARWLLVHLNRLSDAAIDTLARYRERCSVVYCPMALRYFQNPSTEPEAQLERQHPEEPEPNRRSRTGPDPRRVHPASRRADHEESSTIRHRYRELIDRGVNVCLGTDSILCQPPELGPSQRLGLMPAIRTLFREDRTCTDRLLAMATLAGARALQAPPLAATLAPGAPARLAEIRFRPDDPQDPWRQALEGSQPLQPLDTRADFPVDPT